MADTILGEVQNIIKTLTMFVGGCIYISIWVYLIKNWDEFVRTEYCYPCWEKSSVISIQYGLLFMRLQLLFLLHGLGVFYNGGLNM